MIFVHCSSHVIMSVFFLTFLCPALPSLLFLPFFYEFSFSCPTLPSLYSSLFLMFSPSLHFFFNFSFSHLLLGSSISSLSLSSIPFFSNLFFHAQVFSFLLMVFPCWPLCCIFPALLYQTLLHSLGPCHPCLILFLFSSLILFISHLFFFHVLLPFFLPSLSSIFSHCCSHCCFHLCLRHSKSRSHMCKGLWVTSQKNNVPWMPNGKKHNAAQKSLKLINLSKRVK